MQALIDALEWALGQIDDDPDPDHQAAFATAHAALADARRMCPVDEVTANPLTGEWLTAPGSTVPLQLAALKPVKRPALARPDKRLFPTWAPHMSTADYVRAYFALNSQQYKMPAYPAHVDHMSMYAPLPDTPAATYAGIDTVETDE